MLLQQLLSVVSWQARQRLQVATLNGRYLPAKWLLKLSQVMKAVSYLLVVCQRFDSEAGLRL